MQGADLMDNIRVAKELVRLAKSLISKGAYKKVTQKQIINWPDAKDISDEQLIPEKKEVIAVSHGANGANGCVYQGRDGKLYKITKNCTNLLRVI